MLPSCPRCSLQGRSPVMHGPRSARRGSRASHGVQHTFPASRSAGWRPPAWRRWAGARARRCRVESCAPRIRSPSLARSWHGA